MTTNAQIRAKTVVNGSRRAEPRPQEAISAPDDRTHDRSDPEKICATPLLFIGRPQVPAPVWMQGWPVGAPVRHVLLPA
jgi:hypothetical protein